MWNRLTAFLQYPEQVRYGLGLLAAGWISVFAFLYHIHLAFPDRFTGNEILRVLVVGIGICLCVFAIKPWARKLCLFFNVGIITIHAMFLAIRIASLGFTSPGLTVHSLTTLLLFGISTRFLLSQETAAFFKSQEPRKFDENGKEIL